MDNREATQTAEPQEFPKVLYRGGVAYDETTGRGVHPKDTVVVKDAQQEADAQAQGFSVFEAAQPSDEEQGALDMAELPKAAVPEAQPEDGTEGEGGNSLRRAVDHLDAQGRPASERGGDHSADAAERTGTVDVSRSEDPNAPAPSGEGPVEQYHNQIAHYEEGAGVPHIEGGTPSPPGIATVIVDGKPDILGQTGTREGKVQTDDLDRLDPSKNLRPDGVILPPGGDPAHQNAVEEHGDAVHAADAKSVNPAHPHPLDHDGDGRKGGSKKHK